MHIEVKTSDELTVNDWKTYTNSFNQVFQKALSVKDFENKYLNTIDNYSYHVLLKDDKNNVVGGFTAIPYEYYINNKIIRVGFPLDVFILIEYRTDFLSFFRMYKELKKELLARNIDVVIITPNEDSYQYWKKVIKMKDVGNLPYNILPVKVSNVITKLPKIFNHISLVISNILLLVAVFVRTKEKQLPVRLNRLDNIIEKQRYTSHHKRISKKKSFFSYRIVNEDGIITSYLIDFYNIEKRFKDSRSLRTAIRYIISNEDVDLIIFVGKLTFFQFLLFKVPFSYEPRHLHFMVDIINHDKISNLEIVYNFKNWDFGLFNFDVR